MFFPNDSYWIAIYGGELDLITNSDGIDSNGHIYIHGGKINIFSEGTGPNEPIDHNGNFSLFNTEILGVGTRGIEMVHRGIHKGNQMYAFYSGVISKDKELEILDENNKKVNGGIITKDINYIFYTSLKLNEKYTFNLIDGKNNNQKTKLNITYGTPIKGEDDLDKNFKKGDKDDKNEDDKNGKDNENEGGNKNETKSNYSKNLKTTILSIFIILILF